MRHRKSIASNRKLRNQKFFMEQFRTIQTTLNFIYDSQNSRLQVIMVTSSNKGEGKSFCALHLAKIFAESGKKTLLIDSDMYNPRISRQLLTNRELGLSNYLISESDFMSFIKPTHINNLDLLPAGPAPVNNANIYQTDKMEKLINKSKQNYDIIIIDTPPTLLLNDSRLIGSLCDGVVMIVGSGMTKVNEIQQALNLLELANNKILGVILNRKKYSRKELDGYSYY